VANQSRGQDLRGCPSERHLLYALPQSTGPGVVSLIIGAMRDRLILVRGCSPGTGRLPIKSFNRGLAPLKLDVASGVPDIRVAYRGSADTR
jgi:hypothetical protein